MAVVWSTYSILIGHVSFANMAIMYTRNRIEETGDFFFRRAAGTTMRIYRENYTAFR